ncbi:hypothetical protein LSTR_LSTR014410 [Laodelphax striatellus]|uniref:Uncharacterized protein n=1 Tax=Laodelphax striatellus TaxID=195883 RepID=A0A482X825_LAOST|nr:hypothetical protein LSTR_LSTR014410 [Laodelphax striatellus]
MGQLEVNRHYQKFETVPVVDHICYEDWLHKVVDSEIHYVLSVPEEQICFDLKCEPNIVVTVVKDRVHCLFKCEPTALSFDKCKFSPPPEERTFGCKAGSNRWSKRIVAAGYRKRLCIKTARRSSRDNAVINNNRAVGLLSAYALSYLAGKGVSVVNSSPTTSARKDADLTKAFDSKTVVKQQKRLHCSAMKLRERLVIAFSVSAVLFTLLIVKRMCMIG